LNRTSLLTVFTEHHSTASDYNNSIHPWLHRDYYIECPNFRA